MSTTLDAAHARALGGPAIVPDRLRNSTMGAIIAIAALVAFLPYVAMERGFEAFLLCLASILAFVASCAPILLRRNYDIFEPITFVAINVLLGTTLKAYYVLFVDSAWVDSSLMLGKPPEYLTPYALIITLGLLLMSAGYFVKVPRFPLERTAFMQRTEWSFARLKLIALVFLGVAMLASMLYIRRMGIDFRSMADISGKRFAELAVEGAVFKKASLSYYRWAASLISPVYFLFLIWFMGSGRKLRSSATVLLAFLGLAALALPFLNSSRSSAVTVMAVTVLIHTYMRRRISAGPIALIAVFVLGLFMSMYALRPRTQAAESITHRLGIDDLGQATIGSRHFLDLTKTAHIIDAVPEKWNYDYGATFARFLVAPIPRAVWPSKPVMGTGPELSYIVFGKADIYSGGIPPGIVAELYMNFGYIGIFVGMFLYGVFLRFLYRSFAPVLTDKAGIVIYAIMIIPLTYGVLNADTVKPVAVIIRDLLPVIVCLLFIARRPRPAVTA